MNDDELKTTYRVNPDSRQPDTAHLLSLFSSAHLPPKLKQVVEPIEDLAHGMCYFIDDGPELRVGLRKLVEAKDALVRQRVIDLKRVAEVLGKNTPESELL